MWPSVFSKGGSVPLPVHSISRMQGSPQDRNRLRPLARLIPPGSPHRSMSASTTRPVRHNAPSQLSIVARPHWMASYVPGELIPCAFIWHDPGITPCCKTHGEFEVADSALAMHKDTETTRWEAALGS